MQLCRTSHLEGALQRAGQKVLLPAPCQPCTVALALGLVVWADKRQTQLSSGGGVPRFPWAPSESCCFLQLPQQGQHIHQRVKSPE